MRRIPALGLLLFFGLSACGQTGYLFIKSGAKKRRTFTEGDMLHLKLHSGAIKKGRITMLRNDTIFLNRAPIPRKDVSIVFLNEVKKKPFPADKNMLLGITAGVGLTTVGLSLNDMNSPEKALLIAAVIGYGPLLAKHLLGRLIYTLHRKKFRIGKQYRLQVLDFYLPARKAF